MKIVICSLITAAHIQNECSDPNKGMPFTYKQISIDKEINMDVAL